MARLDASIDKDAASAPYKVEPKAGDDTDAWEYVAVVRVPAHDLSKAAEKPLEVGITNAHLSAILYDEDGSERLEDVKYEVEGATPPLSGETDHEGKLLHEDVDPGYKKLKIAEKYEAFVPTVCDPDQPYVVRVRKWRTLGALKLRLFEMSREGKPLAGLAYQATGPKALSGTTDGSGRIDQKEVPLGQYAIRIEGFEPVHAPACIDPEDWYVLRVRRLKGAVPKSGPA